MPIAVMGSNSGGSRTKVPGRRATLRAALREFDRGNGRGSDCAAGCSEETRVRAAAGQRGGDAGLIQVQWKDIEGCIFESYDPSKLFEEAPSTLSIASSSSTGGVEREVRGRPF